eukprot:TRINITY_DN879_c0_g1_i1.p1 TRINITY_DN879_c0_g1~~TRINITY_DN879_c0_g1_i1.p1  ORF type:complete len:401 (-),score=122.39 TRINITY_DN879_c0_g1_i1:94-1296(-)
MAHWMVHFNDIEFGDKLGEGNFGAVFKGEYMGTKVAIKKLFFVDDQFMQKYIEREMDTLTAIHHPNIVQLLGICMEQEDVYLITEFVNGGDLHKRLLESKTLSWNQKVSYCKDIALAMTYLHSKNIMHRDLKSHNLLLGEGDKIKVCDFGLARTEGSGEEIKAQKTIVGTHEWMAPEISMGQNYDKSADVFSFAMVMYEVITQGDPPPRKLVEGFRFLPEKHKPGIPADTPPELWNILVECGNTEPKDRPLFKDIVKRLSTLEGELPAAPKETPKKKKKKGDGERKKSTDDATQKKTVDRKKSSDDTSAKKADGEKKKKKKKTTDDATPKKPASKKPASGKLTDSKKKKDSEDSKKKDAKPAAKKKKDSKPAEKKKKEAKPAEKKKKEAKPAEKKQKAKS